MRIRLFPPLPLLCPVCTVPFDATPARRDPPLQLHDLTICRACGEVLQCTAAGLAAMPSDVWWALPEGDRDELRRLQSKMRIAPQRERHV